MPSQSGKIILILVLFLLILGAIAYFFLPVFTKQESTEKVPNSYTRPSTGSAKTYSSEDLKISFEYPQKWFIEEKYYFIMMTSYPTKFSSNQKPTEKQIEIDIHKYNGGCHETIDENLKDPACGEGGPSIKPNEILSKEIKDLNGAKFYKYLIKYPSGEEHKFYFLEKADRVLQIDKKPDPSVFEKEFMDIVGSIKFLD